MYDIFGLVWQHCEVHGSNRKGGFVTERIERLLGASRVAEATDCRRTPPPFSSTCNGNIRTYEEIIGRVGNGSN